MSQLKQLECKPTWFIAFTSLVDAPDNANDMAHVPLISWGVLPYLCLTISNSISNC